MVEVSKHTIVYLQMLLATNFLLTCMDEFEGTPIFRHDLKRSAKRFRDELVRKTEDDMDKVWGITDQNENMYNLMTHQENLLKEIAVMRPENCGVILEMIKRYKISPEAFQVWLGTKIIEPEEVRK